MWSSSARASTRLEATGRPMAFACLVRGRVPRSSLMRASPGSWHHSCPTNRSRKCDASLEKGRRICDQMARMRVTMMLADAPKESGGKLFILGGGWSVTGPAIPPSAVALKIDVPWDQANRRHVWVLELLSEDGDPVVIEGEALRVDGEFEVGRPPGVPLR